MALTKEQAAAVQQKVEMRDRARKDKLFLAELLGYDFTPEVHTELFQQYIPFDPTKPWAEQSNTKKRLIIWPRGFYKALDTSTPIATPQGWRTMGELQIGDLVFDEHGQPTAITGVSPVYRNRPCYEVVFSTGDSIVCDEDHLWLTESHADRPSVKTTKQIRDTLTYGNHAVMVADAVQYPAADLPIPPYVLGCWLVRLFKNKDIPTAYMHSSVEQRWELLRGLMDTDGSVSGNCTFTHTNERLAKQVRELVASLGLKPGVITTYGGEAAQTVGSPAYVFTFCAYRDSRGFWLSRKYNRQPEVRTLQRNRHIVDVRPVPSRPVKCITVASPSHLYLAGPGYIPTHNSTSIIVEIIQTILNFPDIRILLMQGSLKTTKGLLSEIASHFQGFAQGSRLAELFPEFCGDKKALKMTGERFTTPARQKKQLPQATVSCASPKSIKTGQHYDVGFFDDLVHAENYFSTTLLMKVERDFTMCIPLIDPGGYTYVTGTRYTFGDLYENIMRHNVGKNEWVISVKDCWLEDGITPRFPLCKKRDGEFQGHTRDSLLAIQATDPVMFASQYLSKPIAEGMQLCTEQMMLEAICQPDQISLSSTVLFIDLASATESNRDDDSVIVAARQDRAGVAYVVDVRGGQWLPEEFAKNVIQMALKHRPLRIMLEKTASCTYFAGLLTLIAQQMGIILPLDYIKVDNRSEAKDIRIKQMFSYLKRKRLMFFPGLLCWAKMVEQFTKYPKAPFKHDDYPDTVALMCVDFTQIAVEMNLAARRPAMSIVQLIEEQNKQTTIDVLNRDREQEFCSEGAGSDFAY